MQSWKTAMLMKAWAPQSFRAVIFKGLYIVQELKEETLQGELL